MMTTEKEVLAELSKIIDPDFQRDIVSLGFVQDMDISLPSVAFTIELTTPACPLADVFEKQAFDLVMALTGVELVNIKMTARKRAGRKMEDDSGLDQVGTILAVSSCKGGVGKSTVAAMIASNLAARGVKVGLLDADIYGPSVPTLFNLHKPEVFGTEAGRIIPLEVAGLKLMSFGFLAPDGPAVLRGPMVAQYVQQMLHNVEWGALDFLIIDMPPGTGDIQLTISQSVRVDASVIVTTPHQLSLTDVRKGIMMFEKVNVPVLGVIENMSSFTCDGCSKKHSIFGDAGKTALDELFGLETLAELPISRGLGVTADRLGSAPEAVELVDAVVRALGRQTMEKMDVPVVSHDADVVTLTWADGSVARVPNAVLRKACGCALCVDEMTQKPLLDPESVPGDIHAESVRTIGNYALAIDWSDGHNTGFFPYKTIRKLAE